MVRKATAVAVSLTLAVGILIGWAVGQAQPQKADAPAK
jgi:hypothetical protein